MEAPTRNEVIARLKEFTKAVTGDTREWSEFYLRIPADPHHDSDFIFTEAVRLLEADKAHLPDELVQRVRMLLGDFGYSADSDWIVESRDLLRDILAAIDGEEE